MFCVLALMVCAAQARPTENTLASLLLNSKVAVNPSTSAASTLRNPRVASRKVVMKELDSKAQMKEQMLALATMAATMMPGAAFAEITPSLQAFLNSVVAAVVVVGLIGGAVIVVSNADKID